MSSRSRVRSVFLGTPDFAIPTLRSTFKNSDLIAVISQPDRPRGRGNKVQPTPVKAWIQNEAPEIPVFTPSSLKKTNQEEASINCRSFLEKEKPDLLVVTAYGNLLPQSILDIPRLGAVNLHASLLPRWRGAAPIQRSIEFGDSETGVCLQKMVLKLDAGAVLKEARFPLDQNINAIELSEKLSSLSESLMDSFLAELNRDESELIGVQQNEELVTYAHKIDKEEGVWKSTWTAIEFHNKCRAFRAWPLIEAGLKSQNSNSSLKVKILKTKLVEPSNTPPLKAGEIFCLKNKVYAGSSDPLRPIELVEIQVPGKSGAPAFQVINNFLQKNMSSNCFLIEQVENFITP